MLGSAVRPASWPLDRDAAGDLLWDGGSNYEYDAEGRVKHSYSTGQWQYPMYNALGQRVEDYQGTDPMTLTYPIDIFGQRTGTFAQWPSQNWTGWNVYWASVAGQRLNMGGADAYIDHEDVIGSTTMETDPAGGVQWKIAYYPWGQILAQGGIRQSVVWAGLDWQVNDPSIPSATREYNDGLGRWLVPDPGGVKAVRLADPQTWNMYVYVANNPTSRVDPSGLQSGCATGQDCGGCSSNGESFEEATMHFSDGRYGLDEITDLGIGMAKGLFNMLISTANLQMEMDPDLHGVPIPEFQATDTMQKAGMVGAEVGLFFVPGAGEEEAGSVASNASGAVKLVKSLASEAQTGELGASIAGAGSAKALRVATELAQQYGGEPGDWAKMRSSSYTARDGTQFETHWYENVRTGQRVEFKTKLP